MYQYANGREPDDDMGYLFSPNVELAKKAGLKLESLPKRDEQESVKAGNWITVLAGEDRDGDHIHPYSLLIVDHLHNGLFPALLGEEDEHGGFGFAERNSLFTISPDQICEIDRTWSVGALSTSDWNEVTHGPTGLQLKIRLNEPGGTVYRGVLVSDELEESPEVAVVRKGKVQQSEMGQLKHDAERLVVGLLYWQGQVTISDFYAGTGSSLGGEDDEDDLDDVPGPGPYSEPPKETQQLVDAFLAGSEHSIGTLFTRLKDGRTQLVHQEDGVIADHRIARGRGELRVNDHFFYVSAPGCEYGCEILDVMLVTLGIGRCFDGDGEVFISNNFRSQWMHEDCPVEIQYAGRGAERRLVSCEMLDELVALDKDEAIEGLQ